jgi:hypothetical protein
MAEKSSTPRKQLQSLEEHRASLESRLQEGYARIDVAVEAGRDVTSWEQFWIDLLHEYETTCHQLQRAA